MSGDAGEELGPGKGSIGLLAQVFPREVVDAAIGRAGVKELLELACLYAARWQVELLFKILKVQLRESGAVLRSKSPAMVRQEIWARSS